jgi:hypothetical protein
MTDMHVRPGDSLHRNGKNEKLYDTEYQMMNKTYFSFIFFAVSGGVFENFKEVSSLH